MESPDAKHNTNFHLSWECCSTADDLIGCWGWECAGLHRNSVLPKCLTRVREECVLGVGKDGIVMSPNQMTIVESLDATCQSRKLCTSLPSLFSSRLKCVCEKKNKYKCTLIMPLGVASILCLKLRRDILEERINRMRRTHTSFVYVVRSQTLGTCQLFQRK